MDSFFRNNEISTDSITDAYTKETLVSYAKALIAQKESFSYALLDIDNFTYINDAFGIAEGNKVLFDISRVIQSIIADRGVLARNNGDEFSVVFKNITDYDEIWGLCHTILVKINEIELPEIGNQTLTVTIGLARYPDNAQSYEDLRVCAEKAMYRGKSKGRNCFIIYLPEKHANLVLKNERQRALGSMNLHSNVFRFLTEPDDLRMGIINLFNFISSYFEVDHVCIQAGNTLLFQKIHQIAKNKKFRFIPHELIRWNMNKMTEVLYVSDTKNLLRTKQTELYERLAEQEISSTCFCEISYRADTYGMLRVDMTSSGGENRLWQYSDMDLLLDAAKTIALVLHYTGKRLEDL